jgi:hypothetical protein
MEKELEDQCDDECVLDDQICIPGKQRETLHAWKERQQHTGDEETGLCEDNSELPKH